MVQWMVTGLSNLVLVHGDETQLRQVLVNLLGNAIKFTESGEIRFTVTLVEENQYRCKIIDIGGVIPKRSK